MHTTTVRFDADAWEAICREADRLGVPRSMLIRDATNARITRREQLTELHDLSTRVDRLEHHLARTVTALRKHVRRA